MSADTAVVMMILIIVVIVLLAKLSGLRGELASRANSEALTMLDHWKAVELRKQVSREVELSIASIKEKAENDVQLAKQQARLDFQKWKTDETIRIRQDSSARSNAVHVGKITEHLIPWFLDGAFDPRDIRFIGSPIDLIVFHGLSAGYVEAIHFIEVKSGVRPILSPREELVRGAAVAGRIAYSVVHLTADGDRDGSRLNWLGDGPASLASSIMKEQIKKLIEQQAEALRSLEFEESADIGMRIFETFGLSIANLSDEIAILRDEIRTLKDPEE